MDARRTPTDAAPRRPCSTGAGGRGWPAESRRCAGPHGSNVTVFPPTRESLHSKQSDLVDRGRGVGPRLHPRRRALAGDRSDAGDPPGRAGMDRVRGRRRVVHVPSGHAARRPATPPTPTGSPWWSTGSPTTSTPPTRQVAARYHPGVASGLIDADYLVTEAARMDGPAFARAYGNVFSVARAAVIPGPTWARAGTDPAPMPARPALGFDCEHDGSGAAIAAAWRDGLVWRVELVDDRPGTAWVPERLAELNRRLPRTRTLRRRGPGPGGGRRYRTDPRRPPYASIPGHSWYAACETFRAYATDGQLAHSAQPGLDAAVAAADARRVGDVWTWDRRAPGARLAPLTAATAALWGARAATARGHARSSSELGQLSSAAPDPAGGNLVHLSSWESAMRCAWSSRWARHPRSRSRTARPRRYGAPPDSCQHDPVAGPVRRRHRPTQPRDRPVGAGDAPGPGPGRDHDRRPAAAGPPRTRRTPRAATAAVPHRRGRVPVAAAGDDRR